MRREDSLAQCLVSGAIAEVITTLVFIGAHSKLNGFEVALFFLATHFVFTYVIWTILEIARRK